MEQTICKTCGDTGEVRWRISVDEWEADKCPDCPPDRPEMIVVPLQPDRGFRTLSQIGNVPVDAATVRIGEYLRLKHTNTWPPKQWSVSDEEAREEAVDWFVDLLIKLGIVQVSDNDPRRMIP